MVCVDRLRPVRCPDVNPFGLLFDPIRGRPFRFYRVMTRHRANDADLMRSSWSPQPKEVTAVGVARMEMANSVVMACACANIIGAAAARFYQKPSMPKAALSLGCAAVAQNFATTLPTDDPSDSVGRYGAAAICGGVAAADCVFISMASNKHFTDPRLCTRTAMAMPTIEIAAMMWCAFAYLSV